MDVQFYVDPTIGLTHPERHGVTLEEVVEVLLAPAEDRPGRRGYREAIGQTDEGRYLRVIYLSDPNSESILVVTAYDLVGKQRAAFDRRRRRKR